MMGLTRSMSDCLGFIESYLAENGVTPSMQEMTDHLGLRSKSSVDRILTSLEDRGFIRRLYRRARSIELLKTGQIIICPHCGHGAGSKQCRRSAMLSRALGNASSENTTKAVLAVPAATGDGA